MTASLRSVAAGAALALLVAATTSAAVVLAYAAGPAAPLLGAGALAAAAAVVARPMNGVYLGILLVPFDLYVIPLGAMSLGAAEAAFTLAGVAWVAHRIAAGKPVVAASPVTLPLAAMIVAVLLGLFSAVDSLQIIKRTVTWTAYFFTFQMVLAESTTDTLRRLLMLLTIAGGLEALLTIAGELGGTSLAASGASFDRAAGTFDHPNTLGTYVGLALPAAVALALKGPLRFRPLAVGTTALLLIALILSLSRGGLLGAAGALVLFFVLRDFRRLAGVAAVAAIGFGLLISAGVVDPTERTGAGSQVGVFGERLTGGTSSSSRPDDRILIWSRTPDMIEDHLLFGVGSNNFVEFAPRYGIIDTLSNEPYYHAHNVPLTMLAETGFVGGAAFSWLLIAAALALWRAAAAAPVRARGYVVAVAGILVALSLQGMVDMTIGLNSFDGMVLALMAAALATGRLHRQERIGAAVSAEGDTPASAPPAPA